MSPREVADLTSLNAKTLRRWRTDGKGPASLKLGSRIAYRRSEVLRWITAQEQATARGGIDEVHPTTRSGKRPA